MKLHGCFHKDTLITLANGELVPISELKKGDNILSYDIENNKEVIKKVKETFKYLPEISFNEKKIINKPPIEYLTSDKNWIELIFSDRSIKCTEDHMFFTKNRGWIEAQNLTDSDIFIIT